MKTGRHKPRQDQPDPTTMYEAWVRAISAPSDAEMVAQMLAEFLEGTDLETAGHAATVEHAREHIDTYQIALRRLRAAQDDRCALCRRARVRLVVDHDHATGLVRGYLCKSCNIIEGKSDGGDDMQAYRRIPPAAVLGIVEPYRHPFGYKLPESLPPVDPPVHIVREWLLA